MKVFVEERSGLPPTSSILIIVRKKTAHVGEINGEKSSHLSLSDVLGLVELASP